MTLTTTVIAFALAALAVAAFQRSAKKGSKVLPLHMRVRQALNRLHCKSECLAEKRHMLARLQSELASDQAMLVHPDFPTNLREQQNTRISNCNDRISALRTGISEAELEVKDAEQAVRELREEHRQQELDQLRHSCSCAC